MVQVRDDHYDFETYITLHRWMSFWHQMNAVVRSGAKTVLELGCGSGIMTQALRSAVGLQVTTFDFDPGLKPDVVGDIRKLEDYFAPASFDCVCAFQVLEHLPYADFEHTLPQLARIARHSVLLSLPHWGYVMELRFRFWRTRWSAAFARKITRRHRWRFDGEHYWELGTTDYPVNKLRRALEAHFIVRRAYFCPDNSYHYFFECTPKRSGEGDCAGANQAMHSE